MNVAAPSSAGWAIAYRPLRPRGLLAQLVVVVAAEVLLYLTYRGHEASFHWATHFLVGLAAAALLNVAWLALKGAPARGQLLWVVGLHLYAMAPDLLFSGAHVPHDGWMDVFLGHISAHYVPAGARAWLLVALASSGFYAWVLSRWIGARRLEADAGMAPGIGLGGDALLRPQHPPALRTLAHDRLDPGAIPIVLLLHGLGGSRHVWRAVGQRLRARGITVLAPDLLGFGASRSIGTTFALDDHVDALLRLLDETAARTVLVAGHSFGCAVAAALATAAPQRVSGLVLVSPPVFADAQQARDRLSQRDWLSRKVVNGSPIASVACGLMCLLRRPVATILGRRARRVPPDVARDGVQHSWPAYRDALAALLQDNPLPAWIAAPLRPTTVVLGDRDPQTPAGEVLDTPHDAVTVIEVDGDHLIVLTQYERIADAIADRANSAPHNYEA